MPPDRIRVLHILEATTGGTRRHLLDVVLNLDAGRFDASVLCATRRDPAFGDDINAMRDHGIDVSVVPMVREIRPFADWRALRRIARRLRGARYDIVHTHSSKAGMLGRLAARRAGVPVIVHTPHAFAFQMNVGAPRRWLYAALERGAARLSDRIICVCPSERAAALRRRIAPPERLTVIENAIDADAVAGQQAALDRDGLRSSFGFAPHDIVLGTAARFTRQKGHAVLVEAAARLPDALPFRLLLAGAGEKKDAIEAMIGRRNLSGVCRVVESLDDTAPFYAAIDVFVLPSLWEGLPYTLLDAMAVGKPIVASNCGGISDTLVDGQTGLLVKPGDPAALGAALGRLMADAGLREGLGAAARRAVQRRDALKQMIEKLEQLYQELYNEKAEGKGEDHTPGAACVSKPAKKPCTL